MEEIKRLQQLAGILTEIKINNPNIITAHTADRRNTEVKVRILEKIWEEKGDKMFWAEYPKGVLDLVIYYKIDNNYSVDHEQGLDETLGEYIGKNPYRLYKEALIKYKLKPNFENNNRLDQSIEEWDEYNNLDEIKVNNPITPDINIINKMYSELGELGTNIPNPTYYLIPNIITDKLIPSKYKRSGHIGTYLQRLKDDGRDDILNKIYNQFQTEINKYKNK